MKYYFILLIALTYPLFIISCTNNNVDIKQSLIGKWELRRTTNGLNKTEKFFLPGKGIQLSFTSTGYTEFFDTSMVSKGLYKIIQDTANGIILNRIAFKPEIYSWDSTRYLIDCENDQLIIAVDTVGTMRRFYERIK